MDYGINAVYLEQYWTSVPFQTKIQQRYFDNFVVSTAQGSDVPDKRDTGKAPDSERKS